MEWSTEILAIYTVIPCLDKEWWASLDDHYQYFHLIQLGTSNIHTHNRASKVFKSINEGNHHILGKLTFPSSESSWSSSSPVSKTTSPPLLKSGFGDQESKYNKCNLMQIHKGMNFLNAANLETLILLSLLPSWCWWKRWRRVHSSLDNILKPSKMTTEWAK